MLKIIISPAKKMNEADNYTFELTQPVFKEYTRQLYNILKELDKEELKSLWNCSDKLVDQNFERLHTYDPDSNLTPALLAYEGIQYQYMAPSVFSDKGWDYVSSHLCILSGLYGILRPTDGVIPYRLEMQTKLKTKDAKDLYQFWNSRLYEALTEGDSSGHTTIINLASGEYSKNILPYLKENDRCITCIFAEEINGKVKVKATLAKMARGEMVRFMAEHQIEDAEEIKNFDRMSFSFRSDLSSENEYVFIKS